MTRARTNADNASLGVTLSGTETISAKTLNSSLINGSRISSPAEVMTIQNFSAGSTVNFDALSNSVVYYTNASTSNWTLNVRGTSSVTLNNSMTTNDSLTIIFMVTNTGTAYYSNNFTIDGTTSGVTIKYQNGTTFSSGNINAVDVYSYTIIKTAPATYTVLANQTKFA
jgi:hypothetical protein